MPTRPPLLRLVAVLLCLAATSAVVRADTISVGAQTGQQIFFNNTLTRTYNFGITSNGSGLTFGTVDVNLKGQANSVNNVFPAFITIYSGLGGTGSILATGSIAPGSLTGQFAFRTVTLSSTLTLLDGGYSLQMTTNNVADYYLKDGALKLTGTSGATLSSNLWVQDSNTDGTAGTTLVASGTVLATWATGTNAVRFGNYRVTASGSITSSIALTNTALATSNNVTQALAATGTTVGNVSITGLPSPYLSVGQTQEFTVGLSMAQTGPNSGTATLDFSSVSGTSATTGTTAIGSGTVAISGTGWNWANAKVAGGTYAFGNVRTGSAATTQTFAIGNQAVSLATYQDLLDVSGSASNAKVTVTGFQNLITSTNGTVTSTVSLAASTATAGSLTGTVALTYVSDANGVVGLTNGSATIVGGTAPTIATTGGVYDFAAATYSGTAFAFGYLHRGAPAVSGSVAIGNQTITNASFQDSLNVSGSTANPLVSTTGFTGLAASAAGATRNNLVVAAATGTAGSLNGTVALSLVSNANGVAGLSNGTATVVGSPGSITTTGTVYTGQSTWITNGGGQWGTLASGFGANWNWATFDGSPGVDAGFTDTDTATFGSAVTSGTAVVTISAATPSVRSVTFSNTTASYVVTGSAGGSLALRNSGTNAATVSVVAGAHALDADIALNSSAAIDVALGSLLAVSGVMSGTNGIRKTGGGELAITDINTFTGPTTVAAGLLRVNGSIDTSFLTTVAAGATLAGTGTVGDALVFGIHSPGNSPGIQTTGSLTYEAGSSVAWELVANSVSGRGTNFDGIDVSGPLAFSGSTSFVMTFNGLGSAVDWSDAFWSTNHVGTDGWLVYSGADSLTGFPNLVIAGTNWADGQGDLLGGVRPNATFTTYQSGANVYVNYVVPEPGTFVLAGLGLGVAGVACRRRRRASRSRRAGTGPRE